MQGREFVKALFARKRDSQAADRLTNLNVSFCCELN
jgi:hypothetical protein